MLTLNDPQFLSRFPARATGLKLHHDGSPLSSKALGLLPGSLTTLQIGALDGQDALETLTQRFTGLEVLDLKTANLQTLEPLRGLTGLREAALDMCNAPVPDLSPIAQVRRFEASIVASTPSLLAQLGHLSKLRSAKFYLPETTAEDLAKVVGSAPLEHLDLWFVRGRSPNALVGLRGATALRELRLGNAHGLSIEEVEAIASLETLRSVLIEVRSIEDIEALGLLHDRVDRLLIRLALHANTTDALLKALAQRLPDIRALDLGNASLYRLTSEGIAALGGLRRLEWFRTGELPTAVKGKALSWLGEQTALAHLHLEGKALGASVLGPIKNLHGLRTLQLSGIKVSDAAAKKLSGMKLEALGLHHVPLTDKGLVELSRIQSLSWLSLLLERGRVGDVGLSALGGLGLLEYLRLYVWNGASYNATTLAPLAGLTRLESLGLDPDIAELGKGPDGLRLLAGLPALKWLGLNQRCGQMDAECMAALRTIPSLLHIYIGGALGDMTPFDGHTIVTNSGGCIPWANPDMSAVS